MPKRSISEVDWAETSGLQSKTHVGNKEVDRGICAATNMKAVYLRTLSLLFQGSKTKKADHQVNTPAQHTSVPPIGHHQRYSQMVLTAEGKLSPDSEGHTLKATVQPVGQCPTCSSVSSLSLERCRFCEGTICQSCCRLCFICSGDYCPKCSLNEYTKEESSICLSCATQRGRL